MKQLLKSVVRQIRTLRSVGAGGGQLPLATRWVSGNRYPYRDRSPDALDSARHHCKVQSRTAATSALTFMTFSWKTVTRPELEILAIDLLTYCLPSSEAESEGK